MKKLNSYFSMASFLGLFMLVASASFAQLSSFSGVTLTFSPTGGGDDIVVSAQLVDQTYVPTGTIEFLESTDYTLTITTSGTGGDNTSTISDNGTQYQFFFGFEDEIFASPGNDGNLAAEDVDPIKYADEDANGLPIGLVTDWTTECGEETTSGTFRMVLRDYADMKSASSDATEGSGIFDISWPVSVAEDPMAPPCENEEEVITDVKLTFTPDEGGDPVVVTAQDPDGEGILDLQIMGEIELLESTDYTLTVELTNSIEGEDITEEIMEEDDEHQFFFSFTDAIFASPAGDGNIDNRDDPLNYNDFDENGLPVGLSTGWTTECGQETTSGMFRIVLKHQPDIKDSTSTSNDGGTDIDLEWPISVTVDPDAPACENEEEIITDVILTFTPDDGGDPVIAMAQDPDGEGALDLMVSGPIELLESTDYTLTIELTNSIEGEDITEEIEEEDNEHQFFFAFTDEIFASPAGDGNIDNRDDPLNYNDFDENGLPVGLSTGWTTECGEETTDGKFRVVLKHQPDIKDSTSTSEDGGTDIDLEWDISLTVDPDAPECENEEEIITDVKLTFTPDGGGDPIVAAAQDPDGEGALDLVVLDDIVLLQNTTYTLSVELTNSIEGEDITEEIEEEDDEHQFFFGWTGDVFSSPTGDGNIDNRDDDINYLDEDENGLPVGLSTSWTAADGVNSGIFNIILKHQPDIKDDMSTSEDGGTDIDLEFNISTATSVSIDKTLGDSKLLSLYPNPASTTLNWELENTRINHLEIVSLMGQTVYESNTPESAVAIDQLANGVYFIKLNSEKQVWLKKFVIAR
ncbi:MAG: T9SS type A sorting domain-containing protein [Bacteroidota bacterium]